MQRLTASALLAVVSFLLTLPLFGSGMSGVPECCRRLGRHHCLLVSRASASPSSQSPAVRAALERCPFTPFAGVPPLHPAATIINTAQLIFGDAVRHPAIHAQTDAAYRVACTRAHLKRGPPPIV